MKMKSDDDSTFLPIVNDCKGNLCIFLVVVNFKPCKNAECTEGNYAIEKCRWKNDGKSMPCERQLSSWLKVDICLA